MFLIEPCGLCGGKEVRRLAFQHLFAISGLRRSPLFSRCIYSFGYCACHSRFILYNGIKVRVELTAEGCN